MKKAIYAFSGDPITYGHIDVVHRASQIFDHLVVAIGTNPDKQYMFSLVERESMARSALSNLKNVEVTSFAGTLVDFAYENSVNVIVKGIRDSKDFDYELVLYQIGESQKHGIETVFIPARPDKVHVSSSAAKALQKEQGLITDYVPLQVKKMLEQRISNQIIIGITGEIATGKSHVAEEMVRLGQKAGLNVYNIELDQIGHRILEELTDPLYVDTRLQIVQEFGADVMRSDGFVDRKVLGKAVFQDATKLQKLNNIMHKPILTRVRREIHGKSGLIMLNAALMAEVDMLDLCNNHIILTRCSKDTQIHRLTQRGFDPEQIQNRLKSQYDYAGKKAKINKSIEESGYGKLWELESDGDISLDIEKIFAYIL